MVKINDLTQGGIVKTLLKLSLPIIGTSFMAMSYQLIDMIWVGRLGSKAVASVGSVDFYLNLAIGLFSLAEVGTGIKVSQSIGAKKNDNAKDFSENGIFFTFILGVFFTTIMFLFRKQLIGFWGMEEEVTNMANSYMGITVFSILFGGVNMTLSRVFNSHGNTKIPFRIVTVGLLLNIILDPIFIFTFGLGVFGAGLVTLISNILVTSIFIYIIRRHLNILRKIPKFSLDKIKQIINLSLPVSTQRILFSLIYIVIGKIISSYGSEAITIQRIGVKIESISYMIAFSFQSALVSFIGQNYGAKEKYRIVRGYYTSLKITLILGTFAFILFYFFPRELFRIFIDEENIINLGVNYLQILSISQVFMAMEIMSVGAFNGIGKTKYPPINSIIFSLLRIPMAIYFGKYYGLNGVWWAISLSSIIKGAILPLWYMYVQKRLVIEDV